MSLTLVLTVIVVAIIIIVVISAIFAVIKRLGRGIRQSLNVLGTLDEVINAVETKSNQTPRQLQNLTNTYSDLIRRDFPQFDAEEFLSSASNILVMILNTLEQGTLTDVSRFSLNLKQQVEATLKDIQSKGEKWFFDDILVHKACISRYSSGVGTKVIQIEIALQYRHGVLKEGVMVTGSRELEQYKYTLDAVYIQDVTQLGDSSTKGHNCPNCGAPVRSLGEDKFCEYCGTGLTEINVRVWTFDHYTRT